MVIVVWLQWVIDEMSIWEVGFFISCFNCVFVGSWYVLLVDFFIVLDVVFIMVVDSVGVFDFMVGLLVDLWGFGVGSVQCDVLCLLDLILFELICQCCGWQCFVFDCVQCKVQQVGGVYLNFFGIVKGYVVDLVVQVLCDCGCVSWLVEVGGELVGEGVKVDGQFWWVVLECLLQDDSVGMVVVLYGLVIVILGDYCCYVDYDGLCYVYIIDFCIGIFVCIVLVFVMVLYW